MTKADGSPYTVFTPFSRTWKALPPNLTPLPAPNRIPTPVDLASDRIPASPALPPDVPFEASEAAPIRRYHELRDRPDLDGTSQLSPYLRFGLISPRQAAAAAYAILDGATDAAGRRGAEVWLNELIWREFNASILYHFPGVLRAAFRPELRSIPWDNDPELFAAWREGRTGYPIVDAAMRQLVQTGWMHNRARMIVASFLVKDLLIDWRWGERFFMQHLVDGDPASNNGGWQWTAGVV